MSGKRQKIQYALALEPVGQGETPVSGYQGTEPFVAKPTTESPAAEQLMEEVCERENLVRAWLHRTGAALRHAAAELGAVQADDLADRPEQGHVGVGIQGGG